MPISVSFSFHQPLSLFLFIILSLSICHFLLILFPLSLYWACSCNWLIPDSLSVYFFSFSSFPQWAVVVCWANSILCAPGHFNQNNNPWHKSINIICAITTYHSHKCSYTYIIYHDDCLETHFTLTAQCYTSSLIANSTPKRSKR